MTGNSNASDLAIDELLRAAIAAPSLHNAQPWRLRVKNAGTTIEIFADPDRMLPVSDPHGRAAYIGCGAALLNLRVVAGARRLQADVALTPDPLQPLFVAQVELSDGRPATAQDRELAAAISLRHTNREPYSNDAVPADVRTELAHAALSEGCVLRFLDDNEAVRVRRLATDAERELLGNPAYRAELARWVTKERRDDGIPAEALGPRSAVGRDPVRDFSPSRPAPVRYADFEYAPQLAVLSARANTTPNWIAAGQALERVWLTATCRGIALCPLTQPLETADAWLVRDTRWGYDYPQMIMRIGYGPQVTTHSPRRAVRHSRISECTTTATSSISPLLRASVSVGSYPEAASLSTRASSSNYFDVSCCYGVMGSVRAAVVRAAGRASGALAADGRAGAQ